MSDPLEWREEAIARHHDRSGFDCGSAELNDYPRKYARQNHETGGAKSFVAVPPLEPHRVLGYYSIGPGAIEFLLDDPLNLILPLAIITGRSRR